jgi:integrase/recombinase XerD
MRDPSRVRVVGPLAPFQAGFAAELAESGYRRVTVALQLRLMAHMSAWLVREGLDAHALSPAALEQFWADRRAAGYGDFASPKALAPLLGYLRGLGVVPPAQEPELTVVEALLERYRTY